MPHWRITVFTITAGIAAILILGRLPALERGTQELRAKMAIAAPQQMLSDDNLADAMVGLQLQERLTRVGWDHSILTIDLTLRAEAGTGQAIAHDLTELIRFAFGDAGNVRQLLFRVYRQTGGSRALLLYGDGRREDWRRAELASLLSSESLLNEQFSQKLRLVKTAAGERWLLNSANS
ncbi:MAG: hypothetical protein JWR03_1386 [Cohnella sp.]|nr:hypothetical protein [Cohnella sp.]